MNLGGNSGSIRRDIYSFCIGPGVFHDKGWLIFCFIPFSLFCYVYAGLNFDHLDYPAFYIPACSFELFDLLLFLVAYFRFFYLCACVVLLYRYVFFYNFDSLILRICLLFSLFNFMT